MTDTTLNLLYHRSHTLDQILYASIRYFPHEKSVPYTPQDYHAVFHCIEHLYTPRRFMRLFPIDKTYDGARFQCKDYFSTMEMCRENGMDVLIKDAVSFLWDYCNPHIRRFLSGYLTSIDRQRFYQGQKSLFQTFLDENGIDIPSYQRIQALNGQVYMRNTQTGQFLKTAKPSKKPKWWKIIEGGNRNG